MRDSRVLVSKQINWIELLSNALQIGRTSQFIGHLGITVRLNSIDGSNETVHRELFQLDRSHLILMERLDESTWSCVMKCIRSASVGSRSDDYDAFPKNTSWPLIPF